MLSLSFSIRHPETSVSNAGSLSMDGSCQVFLLMKHSLQQRWRWATDTMPSVLLSIVV